MANESELFSIEVAARRRRLRGATMPTNAQPLASAAGEVALPGLALREPANVHARSSERALLGFEDLLRKAREALPGAAVLRISAVLLVPEAAIRPLEQVDAVIVVRVFKRGEDLVLHEEWAWGGR